MLVETGTVMLKFLLHISKDEQRQRLQERLDDPNKHWKFAAGDLEVRKQWDDYQQAYNDAIAATGTPWAPWTIVPADSKTHRNLMIATVVKQALRRSSCATRPATRRSPASASSEISARRRPPSTGDTMTDLSAEYKALADYRPTHKVRFVTAASLFDGHDAAINIMRRILQGMGAEVIHLGPQPLGRRGRHRGAAGGRAGHRHQLATRAATSSTSSTWSTCCASAAARTSRSSAAAAA